MLCNKVTNNGTTIKYKGMVQRQVVWLFVKKYLCLLATRFSLNDPKMLTISICLVRKRDTQLFYIVYIAKYIIQEPEAIH